MGAMDGSFVLHIVLLEQRSWSGPWAPVHQLTNAEKQFVYY